jgi:MFS family permease
MSRLYTRSFVAAILAQFGFVVANMLMTHYARWVSFLGGTVEQIGWVGGVGSIAGLLLRPWLGQWINRIGARRTFALGLLLFAIGSFGSIFLVDLGWQIYVLRSFSTAGAAFVFTSSLTYASQICPPERRTEAIGILGVGGFLGMLSGPYMGDLFLGDGERQRTQFTALFITATLSLLIPAFLLLFMAPRPTRGTSRIRIKDFFRVARRYWPGTILLVDFAFGVCTTVPFFFLANYIDVNSLSMDGASEIAWFFLGYAGWGMTLRIAWRRVPERIGRRKILLLGLVLFATGMFSFLVVTPERAHLLIVPALLCGTGHSLLYHTMTSLTLEGFPDEVRGTGSALSLMFVDIGFIGGSPILGMIAEAHGYNALFVTVGVTTLTVAALYATASIPVWRARRNQAVR